MPRILFKTSMSSRVSFALLLCFSMILSACSTNPATGERQFASFMSPQQENQVGAQEHEKVLKQFGGLVKDKALTDYVNKIGQKLAQNTERPDVQYKFFLLDSPEANAFAIPGGYIYITRGILALANDEAELAAVLGHEIGHITGRHSAERYSHGVVTSLGAAILGAAVDNPNVARAANLGQNLYLSSYSRSQENEADMLGVRYLHRAGYDPSGMNRFLTSLGAFSALEAKANGQGAAPQVNYFSTHPLTQERVSKTAGEARKYPQNQMVVNKSDYLKKVMGLAWGSSAAQGFERDGAFIHPEIGFKFNLPEFANVINRPTEVIISPKDKTAQGITVMDMGVSKQEVSPQAYIQYEWMEKEPMQLIEPITINGIPAATAVFPGHINGRAAQIRLIALSWAPKTFIRFQIAMPQGISAEDEKAYKAMAFSFQRISKGEVGQGDTIGLVMAQQGDTIDGLARNQNKVFGKYSSEYFRVLNGLIAPQQNIRVGELYKVIRQN